MAVLTVDDAKDIIQSLERRFDGPGGQHERARTRVQHYQNLPAADPVFDKAFGTIQKYQTDVLRRTHVKLRSRLTENKFTISAEPPKPTASWKEKANRLETVLHSLLWMAQERERIKLQGGLVDGLNIRGLGWVHWSLADQMWPKVPDNEYLDVLPDDDKDSYEANPDYEEGGEGTRGKRYREKDTSVLDRTKRSRARAGSPFYFEILPTESVYWVEDRSLANGLAMVAVKREVGLLDYKQKLADGRAASLNEVNTRLPVYGERAAPDEDKPSAGGWGERITVWQLWTRTEFYEISCGLQGQWKLEKSGTHKFGMPPFALCPGGVDEGESDPALRYLSPMEGLYRLKPDYDRYMTLLNLLVEQNALPLYYLEEAGTGRPMLDEDGNKVMLSRNSALVEKVPAGYVLKQVPFEVNQAFIGLGDLKRQEITDAAPSVGQADVSAATEPWAIRLQQQQAAIEPGMYLENVREALNTMVHSLVECMSQMDDTIWVFKRDLDGKEDRETVIGIDPKDILSLDVRVAINATSGAEQITKQQQGLTNLKEGVITFVEYVEDYEGKPNAEEVARMRYATNLYEQTIRPVYAKQKLAQVFGTRYVQGMDGQDIGMGGQPVRPQEILGANGITPIYAPGGGGPQAQGMMQGAMPPGPAMPSLPTMQGNGAPAMAGMPG